MLLNLLIKYYVLEELMWRDKYKKIKFYLGHKNSRSATKIPDSRSANNYLLDLRTFNEPVAIVVESVVTAQRNESSYRQAQREEELRRRVSPHRRVR